MIYATNGRYRLFNWPFAQVKPPMLPISTHWPFVHMEYEVEVQVMLPDGLHAPEAPPEELPEEALLPEGTDVAAGAAAAAAEVVATGATGADAEFEPAVPEPEPAAAEDATGAAGATELPLPLPDEEAEELEAPPGTEPPVRPVKLRPVKLGREVKSPLALAPEIVIGAQFIYVSAVTLESQTQANTASPSLS
jgi:hypothetical protein